MIYQGIALEGGGVAGTSYAGLVEVLDQLGIYSKLTHFAGSSAGAMVAGLMACRVVPAHIREILLKLDYRQLEDNDWFVFRDLFRLYNEFGWNKGQAIKQIYGDILEEYVGNRNITYAEVKEQFNATLITTATDVAAGKTIYYGPDTSPDLSIVDGIRESISIPVFYIPVRKDETIIVDGGMLNNYPIQKLYEYLPKEQVFGAKFVTSCDKTKLLGNSPELPKSLLEYVRVLVRILHDQNLKVHVSKEDWERTISIDIGDLSATGFSLTTQQKENLIKTGGIATRKFFN